MDHEWNHERKNYPGSFSFSFPGPNLRLTSEGNGMSAKFWHRLSHECELWKQGLEQVAGVDEAGCGPLAGPVVAAAVVFPNAWLTAGLYSKLRGLNDSKQLTEEQRDKFFNIVTT